MAKILTKFVNAPLREKKKLRQTSVIGKDLPSNPPPEFYHSTYIQLLDTVNGLKFVHLSTNWICPLVN